MPLFLRQLATHPIVELNRYGAEVSPLLLAKLEFTNPGGSMKDRAALGMIEWAEREHQLSPGAEIIISTSGNLGIGMAMTCAVKGYQLICLVDPKLNPSTERSLELLGAELVKVDERDQTGGYHLTRLKRLETLQAERPNAIYLDQYDSPAAIEAHRSSTWAGNTRTDGRPPRCHDHGCRHRREFHGRRPLVARAFSRHPDLAGG
jgi:cysteine synthase